MKVYYYRINNCNDKNGGEYMRRFFNNPISIGLIAVMAFWGIKSLLTGDLGAWFMARMLMLPGIVIGLSFHEFAHAAVAYKLGDMTPKFQGRVTTNPMAHIDPIGFISLLLIGFGWGKPVQINPRSFKKPRRDEMLVAIAGVAMNLILAIVFMIVAAILLKAGVGFSSKVEELTFQMVIYIVQINLMLMAFNLLPIPPLDGFNIVTELFDLRKYDIYYTIYNNSMIILLAVIMLNIPSLILSPIIDVVFSILASIFL